MSISTTDGRGRRSWMTVLNGTRLRELRRERGLSQEQLAGRAGISLATVARLERQSRAPCRGRTLARLAVALDEQPASMRLPTPAAD
jgi:transcriptional regulator with XRE-family HTH domain